MKILLLGEFSALHKNLKDGLIELGHEVTLASKGDGWKNIERDINLKSNKNTLLGKIENRFIPFFNLHKLLNYDIVQLINPFYFHMKYFPEKLFLNILINKNKKFFILAAGDDAYFWRYGRKRLKYGPFESFLKYDEKKTFFWMESEKAFLFNKWLVEKSNGVIPIMYEYEISYQGCKKLKKTIPIPINTKKIKYTDNIVRNNKIVIFHGLNRYGFKGTNLVEKAFEILSKKYPNDLELIIKGRMPLEQYLKLMEKTNVVIDQTWSHSLGVNGLYALAMGKVVLGGAEPKALKSLGVDKSPVINIKPNVQSIVEEIEKLLEKRKYLEQLGHESRKFAEEVHGHIHVAKKYIETWKSDKCVE